MNLPNALSLVRIIIVPIMVIIYAIGFASAPIFLVVLFIAAAFTDFLDGHIARKYNMVTDLGKLLDPIADKLLVLFGLFFIAEEGLLPYNLGTACGVIVVGREFLISIVRQIAASKGKIIHANVYGKLKTIFQDIAIPLFLLMPYIAGMGVDSFYNTYEICAFALFGISVALALISLVVYLKQNMYVFKDSKKKL